LRRALERELAVMDAAREPGRHLGHGILAIDGDEVGKRGEQRGIGEHLGLYAVMQRLFPRIEDIPQRGVFLGRICRAAQVSLCRLQV
jgi:hypothetical protein